MKWISVDDRLPAGDEDVLVYQDGIVVSARYWDLIGKWIAGDIRIQSSDRVTHWKPLPPPP